MGVTPARLPLAALAAAAAATCLVATVGGSAAYALNGATATNTALTFAVKINIGDSVRACTGALINRWWLVTAKSCFADGSGAAVPAGPPAVASTATIGRLDLTGSDGYQRTIDKIVPHPTRDLVLARLSESVRDARTIPVATTAPVAGEKLIAAGYGRTADTWVPNQLHTGEFSVGTVGAAGFPVAPTGDVSICKGDAGGPLLRPVSGGYQLAGLHATSGLGGCLAETGTSHDATETRVDDLTAWITTNAVLRAVTQISITDTRIGVLTDDGVAYVKEGTVAAPWIRLMDNAKEIVVADDRIGVLSTAGVAYVKEGAVTEVFHNEYSSVKQLVVSGNRIGNLHTDGTARVKEGALNALWHTMLEGVQQLEVTDTRVGVLTTTGYAQVKEGALNSEWHTMYPSVKHMAIDGTRVGVVLTNGTAMVKDGALNAYWTTEATSGIASIALKQDRIGLLTTDGVAKANEGALTSAFVTEATGVRDLAISKHRVGIVTTDGSASVKDGGLSAGWTPIW